MLFLLVNQGFSQDVGVSAIINPTDGCNIGNDSITISIDNTSPFPVGGTFTLSYAVDGGAPVNENYTTSIPASSTINYTFTAFYNFNTAGTHQVCATVTFIGDVNPANNTLCINIINDTTVVGGTVSGNPSLVCALGNSGTLILTGNNNTISEWQFSTSGGPPWTSVSPLNNNDSLNFLNLTQQTFYTVLIDGGFCPDDYSSVFTVNVDQPSNGGILNGSSSFCDTLNSGTLTVTGVLGNILDWETSITGSFPGTSTGNITNTMNYNNVSQTTYYQVYAKNGVCPIATSSVGVVTILPQVAGGTVTGGDTFCSGANSGNLTLTGYAGDTIYWIWSDNMGVTWNPIANNSGTQPYFNVSDTIIYGAIVQYNGCPADTSAYDTIYVTPIPVADAGINDTIYLGEITQLNATGSLLYNWTPPTALSDPNISNPFASPVVTTVYTVTVSDIYGCFDTDNVTIFVIDTNAVVATDIVVCNFVTRNGDGLNDVWNITGIDSFQDTEVLVFNNQGQIVFEEKGYLNTWKGTYNGDDLPDGAYFYVVKVGELDKTVKGTLTLLSK